MKLWRLVRPGEERLDGLGAVPHGGRYVSPGRPVVHFASEAGLAVLIALRYLPEGPDALAAPYRLGWTVHPGAPEPVPAGLDAAALRAHADRWLDRGDGLLLSLPSAVLPEAQVILMNPRHPAAAQLPPLASRPFTFAECLHRPPMLDRYRQGAGHDRAVVPPAGQPAGSAPAAIASPPVVSRTAS